MTFFDPSHCQRNPRRPVTAAKEPDLKQLVEPGLDTSKGGCVCFQCVFSSFEVFTSLDDNH